MLYYFSLMTLWTFTKVTRTEGLLHTTLYRTYTLEHMNSTINDQVSYSASSLSCAAMCR